MNQPARFAAVHSGGDPHHAGLQDDLAQATNRKYNLAVYRRLPAHAPAAN
jgi:hypothetical protein